MPVYVYKCGSCGLEFEKIMNFKSYVSECLCPECNGTSARRIPSPPPVVYKADGFTKMVKENG